MQILSKEYTTEINKTLKLAFPIMVAQLGVVLMGITDNLMVGRFIGKIGLGASGIANSIAFLIGSIAVGGMSVVAPLISKAKAENNPAEINRLFRASIKAALWFGLILGIIGWVCVVCFDVFRQSPEISDSAPAFLTIIVISNIFLFVFAAAKQLSDGLSHTHVAMIITFSGLLLNVFFNYLLINGVWGLPALGLHGAAVATLFVRILMSIGILIYIYQNPLFRQYLGEQFNSLKTNDLVIQIFKLGVPSGLQFFFEIAAFSLAVVMMGWLGENQLAAHQIAINIASATYMMASGIGVAGGIRVGEGRGLRNKHHIGVSGNVAYGVVVVFMLFCMLMIICFDRFFVESYIKDAAVIEIAIRLMVIAAIFQLSDGIQVVALGTLRGLSDVNIPTVITMFAYWGVSLPLGYYLAFNQKMEGVWYGLLAGLTASAVLLTSRFYYLLKRRSF
ncbi:MAG: MATE family efflux transporter [Spirosomaceae bacterium]|nr:MATE family efflux transporter [Spirosomataceae bacterium]